MDKKNKAIVLGGTFPHISLIKKLKKIGYYVILIDYLENPPAKIYADEHIQESTLDKEKVLQIAQINDVKLIISTCIDQANLTACFVAEKLQLPKPYSYQTAINVTNKMIMKEKMLEFNIPTSKYYTLNNIKDIKLDFLNFPVIVKPSNSSGSKGVKKACNYDELNKFVKEALELSRNNTAIIEEYKEGREIGVDCYIKNNQATIIMTRERKKIKQKYNDQIQQIYGSFWPANLTIEQYNKLEKIATDISHAFNLNNTPLLIQTIIDDNEIYVIEFAPRVGGGENYKIIKMHTNFDIIDSAINSFLGKEVDLDLKLPVSYIADNYIYTKPGLFGNIKGFKKLKEKGIIEYAHIYKTRNSKIGSELSSNNRVGAFVVKAPNIEKLHEKINIAIENIEAYDINDNPIMRKDIY